MRRHRASWVIPNPLETFGRAGLTGTGGLAIPGGRCCVKACLRGMETCDCVRLGLCQRARAALLLDGMAPPFDVRWKEAAPELTGRTDGNKRVVFSDGGVVDGLGGISTWSRGSSHVSLGFSRR